MILRISRTRAFRDYQRRVGSATYFINTIAVGLELVAAGGEKPTALHIKWQRPSSPRDVANQARAFALVAIFNLGFDSFDVYLRKLGRLPWLTAGEDVRRLLRKDGRGPGGKQYSEAERLEALIEYLNLRDLDGLVAMLDLLTAWRNKLIHSEADRVLNKSRTNALLSRAEFFSSNYAGLKISEMLDNFRRDQSPSLKETTSLIAATMNLARLTDEAVISDAACDEQRMLDIARTILTAQLLVEGQGTDGDKAAEQASPALMGSPMFKDIWSMDPSARTRKRLGILRTAGVTDAPDGPSAGLDSHFLDELASMSRDEAFKELVSFRSISFS